MQQKRFTFTIDDNIRFFRELSENNAESIFSHPYTKMLKELHEKFGVKIQLNLFFQEGDFNLSAFSDKYRAEWEQNADWLKLSFHSKEENVCPYENSGCEQVYNECKEVEEEILRFAGEQSLGKTTTIHWCQTTLEGLKALKERKVLGLLGLYGSEDDPAVSYLTPEEECKVIRAGGIAQVDGIAFTGIDVILNGYEIPDILAQLQAIADREIVKIMIHEQYFYEDYSGYQRNFREKLEQSFAFLLSNGFHSAFFEELL